MAYRRPSRKSSSKSFGKSFGSKFREAKILPQWTPAHSDTVNMAAQSIMLRLGITDIPSYWHKLRTWIISSVIVCILVGASNYGLKGVVLGGLLGLAAPAALIWLGVMLTMIALYLVVWCLAWLAIWFIAMWLLHS